MPKIKEKRKPKSGQHFVALLVGGTPEFQKILKQHTAKIGVDIKHIWSADFDKMPLDKRHVPKEIDVAIILRDPAISRAQREKLAWRIKDDRTLNAFSMQPTTSTRTVAEELAKEGFYGAPIIVEQPTPTAPPPVAATPATPAAPVPAPTAPTAAAAAEPTGERRPARGGGVSAEVKKRMVEVGAMLRDARDKLGLSQKEMSKLIVPLRTGAGFSGWISDLENGKDTASDEILDATELAYGVPTGTIPRLAMRHNHLYDLEGAKKRIAAFHAARKPAPTAAPVTPPLAAVAPTTKPTPPPAPVPAAPKPAAAPPAQLPLAPSPAKIAPPPVPVAVSPAEGDLNDRRDAFKLQLFKLQRAMPGLGIERVDMTATTLLCEDTDLTKR